MYVWAIWMSCMALEFQLHKTVDDPNLTLSNPKKCNNMSIYLATIIQGINVQPINYGICYMNHYYMNWIKLFTKFHTESFVQEWFHHAFLFTPIDGVTRNKVLNILDITIWTPWFANSFWAGTLSCRGRYWWFPGGAGPVLPVALLITVVIIP